ncbi:hypothetical protein BD626DRAFT_176870 [Schizophyllum amplum]|uniref:Uncharacterized protein n=1 Tax=Schizophyllum amplum TaxID=97359 RepID=A0A550C256_9AGAR|nr:hypothetical protein BD626DRAFT_176870 [Auriculariopsis ampla]
MGWMGQRSCFPPRRLSPAAVGAIAVVVALAAVAIVIAAAFLSSPPPSRRHRRLLIVVRLPPGRRGRSRARRVPRLRPPSSLQARHALSPTPSPSAGHPGSSLSTRRWGSARHYSSLGLSMDGSLHVDRHHVCVRPWTRVRPLLCPAVVELKHASLSWSIGSSPLRLRRLRIAAAPSHRSSPHINFANTSVSSLVKPVDDLCIHGFGARRHISPVTPNTQCVNLGVHAIDYPDVLEADIHCPYRPSPVTPTSRQLMISSYRSSPRSQGRYSTSRGCYPSPSPLARHRRPLSVTVAPSLSLLPPSRFID